MFCEKIDDKTKEVFGLTSYKYKGYIEVEDVEQAYNGRTYLKGYAPKKPLEEIKQEKREEINQARDKAEQGGFEYLGKVFDSDPISCQRISCAAQSMSLMSASEENKIVWTCQDNTTIELTAAELSGLVVALSQWSIKCHTKASELKAQIDAAKTAEELEAIVWAK